ncbi:MAG TPA: DUF721 domain-containing protein [Candidatus Coprenecus stercoravium]|uniref:DUF721 domain-containing protein n=1 Tax=Candidatus Coprenecus stercoravium TaxID=2840735 RepID=A0A9D2GQ60_9BACT|nr:DUF721 domain-containing protein [Candidatus Coprenecus stercoravium]
MQRTGAVKLGELLSLYVDEVRLRDSFVSIDVEQAWRKAVGLKAAAATSSSYFKDGILYCNISSSIIRNQLHYQTAGIISDINAMLGSDTVRKIVLR